MSKYQKYEDSAKNSVTYQSEVYKLARKLIKENKINSVLDIGCGYGEKLKKFIYPICSEITGIDSEHGVSYCKEKHNFGKWYVDNLDNPRLNLFEKFDLVISADVIEHLENPDILIDQIKKYSKKNSLILLSTIERNSLCGKSILDLRGTLAM